MHDRRFNFKYMLYLTFYVCFYCLIWQNLTSKNKFTPWLYVFGGEIILLNTKTNGMANIQGRLKN